MTMRNRKTVIAAFVLVAVMLMAVGFAALTDTLNIIGEAEVDFNTANSGFDADVYFSGAVAANAAKGDEAVVTTDNDIARFSVRSLASKNESTTFTFTVQNDNEFDVYVKVNSTKTTNNNTEYFSVAITSEQVTVPAGGTADVTVTVTLLKTPQLDVVGDKVTGTFTFELDVQDEEFN